MYVCVSRVDLVIRFKDRVIIITRPFLGLHLVVEVKG